MNNTLIDNEIQLLLLKNKEIIINEKLQIMRKKYKKLKQKIYMIEKDIKNMQWNKKKYQTLKNNILNKKEEKNLNHYIIPFFFVPNTIFKIFLISILIKSIIIKFYNEDSNTLTKKINMINSELKNKRLKLIVQKKEIIEAFNRISILQKLLRENRTKQNLYYIYKDILIEQNNINSKQKVKNN